MSSVNKHLCECGCKKRTKTCVRTGKPTRFLAGHYFRDKIAWIPIEGIHYAIDPKRGCWLWLGCTGRGYAQAQDPSDGRMKSMHVVMWKRKHGPVPRGMVLDHVCRISICINEKHCEPVTMKTNQRRNSHCHMELRKPGVRYGRPPIHGRYSKGQGAWITKREEIPTLA